MPTERIVMRRVREMLRLSRDAGLGLRAVAAWADVAPSTVGEMLRRFEASGLVWPLPLELTDAELEERLYGVAAGRQGHRRRAEPDWAALNRELKKKHVTLRILWDEYVAADPQGYRYSRFCELYRAFEARLPVTMRQTHLGGDKLFVDYAGDLVPVIVDARTGEMRRAHVFVAVMGGSSLSFACASWTETLPDWIDAHVQAFAFFGGAPRLIVPDNPKVAVIRASLYDPQVNRTYGEMAAHYGTAVLPARPRRPRDKAKVEAAVRIVERWLLGALRHRRFHGLADVNAAIAELLTALNERRMLRHVGRTRRQLFEEIDAPKLKALPAEPYQLAEWRVRKVSLDYHVDVDGHFYSVPFRHARAAVEVRATLRASPRTCAAPATGSTPRWLSTCPPATGATPTGLPSASSARRPRSGRRCGRSARSSSSTAPTPSRATARASASCASPDRSDPRVSKRLACAALRSARAPTAR